MKNKLLLIKLFVTLSVFTIATFPVHAQQDVKDLKESKFFMVEKTEISKRAIEKTNSMNNSLLEHADHQVVIALPLQNDGMMYSGKVTYSSSKPIEIAVLNPFNATDTNEVHGKPLNAVFENRPVAISFMPQFNGEFNAGSLEFVGSVLIFHSNSSKPFSISYGTSGYISEEIELPK